MAKRAHSVELAANSSTEPDMAAQTSSGPARMGSQQSDDYLVNLWDEALDDPRLMDFHIHRAGGGPEGGRFVTRLCAEPSSQEILDLFPLSAHLTFTGLVKFWEMLEAAGEDGQVTNGLLRYGISVGDFEDLTQREVAIISRTVMQWKINHGLWEMNQGTPQPINYGRPTVKRFVKIRSTHAGVDEYVAVDAFGRPLHEREASLDLSSCGHSTNVEPREQTPHDMSAAPTPSRFIPGGSTIRLINNEDTASGNSDYKKSRRSRKNGRSFRRKPAIPERTSSLGAPLKAWMQQYINLDQQPDLSLSQPAKEVVDTETTSPITRYLTKLHDHVSKMHGVEQLLQVNGNEASMDSRRDKRQSRSRRAVRDFFCL